MQLAITALAVIGGLMFSVSAALLAEELFFGQVFRVFFSGNGMPAKQAQKR